jgi:hypothetical protein
LLQAGLLQHRLCATALKTQTQSKQLLNDTTDIYPAHQGPLLPPQHAQQQWLLPLLLHH